MRFNTKKRLGLIESKKKKPHVPVMRMFWNEFHQIPGTDKAVAEAESLCSEATVFEYDKPAGYEKRIVDLQQQAIELWIDAALRHGSSQLAKWLQSGCPDTWPEPR